MEAFASARADWEKVITGHVVVSNGVQNYMKRNRLPIGTNVPNSVDDIYIVGAEAQIDGAGNILGSGKLLLEHTISL
jgi:hypothetical protein